MRSEDLPRVYCPGLRSVFYRRPCSLFLSNPSWEWQIQKTGLLRLSRHHVHLSADIETARNVGQRHGTPVVFEVLAEQMFLDKFEFYLSDNGVWLTDHVPLNFLRRMDDDRYNAG